MIKRIAIENFKSFRSISLDLGSLNVFVGTNASGKSNFFDALRVLQGVGYGYTVSEIFNGKPKGPTSDVWESIRGGLSRARFERSDAQSQAETDPTIRFQVEMAVPTDRRTRTVAFAIAVSPTWESVRGESLEIDGNVIYSSDPIDNAPDRPVIEVRYYHGKRGRQPHLQFEKTRPVLHQLLRGNDIKESVAANIELCIKALSNMQRIDPKPAVLREYAQAPTVKRMGERGENFAALVNSIMHDQQARDAYVSWLRHLTPTELDDVEVMRGALQEPIFALKEGSVTSPAPILSDGTLRFAAIAAAFFQPDCPELLTIEEIENAIHATRLRLLVELLQNRTETDPLQVVATTHSPIVLAWLRESDYKHTFFCKRDRETGESLVRALSDIPEFAQIVGKQPISDLFAEGWLETVL